MRHKYPYRYNEFELKEAVWYGNGTRCIYSYDEVGNITEINNSAGILANELGGPYSNIYQYDNLYR